MWAIRIFGYNLENWDGWLPLGVGLGAGLLSVLTLGVMARHKAARHVALKPEKDMPDPFVQGSAVDHRRALRRVGNPIKVFLAPPGQDNPQDSAWVLDRSVGGLCLSVEREYATGTFLRVLPSNAPDMAYWIDVDVRSCRPVKGGFELGVQFVKTPPWSILLLFG